MSGVENPVIQKQDGRLKVIQLCKQLFYWQGIWYEPPVPDLDFYRQFFCPKFAQMLFKHRFLRLALRSWQTFYIRIMVGYLCCQVFYLFPMGIYHHWGDTVHVMTNFLAMTLFTILLATVCTFYLQQQDFCDLLDQIENSLTWEQLDTEDQKNMFDRSNSFCYKIVKYSHLVLLPPFCLALCYLYIGVLLRERRFSIREWYPWDTTSSPAFELTLFMRLFESLQIFIIVTTNSAVITTVLIMTKTNFKILNNKIENIRPISFNKVKERKLKESADLAGNSIMSMEGKHWVVPRRINAPGVGIHTRNLWPGPSRVNAPGVDIYTRNVRPGPSRVNAPCVGIYTRNLRPGPSRVNAPGVDIQPVFHPPYIVPEVSDTDEMMLVRSVESHRLINIEGSEIVDIERANAFTGIHLEEVNTQMERMLDEAIEIHVRLTSISNLIASVMDVLMVVVFVGLILLLGPTALVFTKDGHTKIGMGKLLRILYALAVLGIYLIANMAADTITEQHSAVCESMYSSDWTGASPSFKKSMLVIMTRANVPLEVKPTGIDPLSRRNFAEVLQLAYKMLNTLNMV